MNTYNIFSIYTAVLTSIGGASVVILGLSSWLGKVWASRLMETEKHKFQKQLTQFTEALKQENSIEIEKIKSSINDSSHIFKLEKDHEYEQRKKIKDTISKNKIRLIDAAESLNHRMWNFYGNHKEKWHVYDSENFPDEKEYLSTSIHRILTFYYLCRHAENEMIYLDSTIATDKDLFFVKFLKILPQIMTDLSLFWGFDYDKNRATDHFFKEQFYSSIEQMFDIENNKLLSHSQFREKIKEGKIDVTDMANFISGMSPEENRLRWQRLIAMHYVLLMFINTYGYDFQYTTEEQIKELKAKSYIDDNIVKNLKMMLEKFKLLENPESRIIINALID